MKKIVRNLALMMLAFVLAITVVPMDSLAVAPSSAKSATASSAYGSITIKGDQADVLQSYNFTGNACAIVMGYSYTTTSAYVLNSSSYGAYYGRVIPITVSKPGVLVSTVYGGTYGSGISYAAHEIYYDAACSNRVGYIGGPNSGSSVSKAIELPSAGTYYLLVNSGYIKNEENNGGQDNCSASFMYYADTAVRTLTNGVTFETYVTYNDEYPWFVYKATADGYITLQYIGDEGYDHEGSVTLYNSSKKAISGQVFFDTNDKTEYKTVFGVKKGQTYYIRAEYVREYFGIKLTQTAVKEKSGKNRKKAVVVKKNKTVKGTMIAGENKADWYKIKLTKNQVLKVITQGSTSGSYNGFELTIYYSNGKKYANPTTCIKGIDSKYTTKTVKLFTNKAVKIKKGTYYIKISKKDKNASGYYTLKWK